MPEPLPNPYHSETATSGSAAREQRVAELRSKISDLAMEVDLHKTKIAGCVGGGVFLFMLAGLAAYDLLTGKSGLWLTVGVTRDLLVWVATGFGVLALAAFGLALLLEKKRNHARDQQMQELEQELERLLKRKPSPDVE